MNVKKLKRNNVFFYLNDKLFFYLDNYKPNGYAAFILVIIYMAIVSILLVNLLIAMFRYKIKIKEIVVLTLFFNLVIPLIVFKMIQIEFGNSDDIH